MKKTRAIKAAARDDAGPALVKQGRVELRSKDTFMTKVNRTPTVTDDPCKKLPNLYSKQTKPAKLRNVHSRILF